MDEAKRVLYKRLLAQPTVKIGEDRVHRLVFNVLPTSSRGLFSLIEADPQVVTSDSVVVWIKQNPHPERVGMPRLMVSFINPPDVIRGILTLRGTASTEVWSRNQTLGTVTITQSVVGLELVISLLPLLFSEQSEIVPDDPSEPLSAT